MMQTNFFHLLEKPRGRAFQMEDGTWDAWIDNGWWSVTGCKTKEEAINRVTERYHKEMAYFWWRNPESLSPTRGEVQ